ncbi:MAG TPA: hypothetical protein VFK57_00630 [Vicinamibacterales bacterium]|nr:hypothetical protein [Vicinamibacterales bacterium]
MKFHLIYDGELPPESRASADLKHRIRQQLHPQLRALWYGSGSLKYLTMADRNGKAEVDLIANEYERHGVRFVPLVRLANRMGCRLEILLLLREEPHIFSGAGAGDLDNRVKTLMDGLRMPTHQKSDLGTAALVSPQPDENPLFCLVEDDRSIYQISVSTDRLLAPPRPDQKHRDVIAIVKAHITNANGTEFAYLSANLGLETGKH